MSLAWGTVALLTFLLPGFLFFVGLYMPEKFTRDAAPRSVLGQLAGTILVSVGIHGLLFLILELICWAAGTFCVRLDVVLATFQVQGAEQHVPLPELARTLHRSAVWIFLYIAGSSGLGLVLGWWVGTQVLAGKLRFLAQHRWVHRLAIQPEKTGDAFTFAYVLSHVRQDERVLLYRGALRDFALQRDGRFSYVVLTAPQRGYLRLGRKRAEVEIDERAIGTRGRTPADRLANDDSRLLVIEGEDIANVVFERSRYRETRHSSEVVTKAMAALLGIELDREEEPPAAPPL